ncbi:nf-kappa b activating protein [Anaeramoeba flamelloides]|uniref:Nf-kappa b activating protein n=1 Tax=Anaeramoeba flamelloides TaxID=1746091 RepID=A0AAV7Y1E4_9EUKA|nr:nf-kappa b activating protein [Anaeramoeba flamelloides]
MYRKKRTYTNILYLKGGLPQLPKDRCEDYLSEHLGEIWSSVIHYQHFKVMNYVMEEEEKKKKKIYFLRGAGHLNMKIIEVIYTNSSSLLSILPYLTPYNPSGYKAFRGYKLESPDSNYSANKDKSPHRGPIGYTPQNPGIGIHYKYPENYYTEGERLSQQSYKKREMSKRKPQRNNRSRTYREENSKENQLGKKTHMSYRNAVKYNPKKDLENKKKEKNTQKRDIFSKNALFVIGKKENILETTEKQNIEKHFMSFNPSITLDQSDTEESNLNSKSGKFDITDPLCGGSSNPRGGISATPKPDLGDSTLTNELNSEVQRMDSELSVIKGKKITGSKGKKKEKEKKKEKKKTIEGKKTKKTKMKNSEKESKAKLQRRGEQNRVVISPDSESSTTESELESHSDTSESSNSSKSEESVNPPPPSSPFL